MKKNLIYQNIFIIFTTLFYLIPNHGLTDELKVVTEYLEPYQIKNLDGSLGGYSTEVVEALFQQLNIKSNIRVMPWARAYKIAKEEKNVLIYSIAHTNERDNLFQWVGSFTKERLYFWGIKAKFPVPVRIEALLKGYTIAASRNSNISDYLIAHNFFNIYPITIEDQGMEMLFRHRVDLIVETELNAKHRAKKLGLDFDEMIKIKEIEALNNDLSLAFSFHSDPLLVLAFQNAFKNLKISGTLNKLKNKWGIVDE
jgi:polar amino acid transport system substrate-binding protein